MQVSTRLCTQSQLSLLHKASNLECIIMYHTMGNFGGNLAIVVNRQMKNYFVMCAWALSQYMQLKHCVIASCVCNTIHQIINSPISFSAHFAKIQYIHVHMYFSSNFWWLCTCTKSVYHAGCFFLFLCKFSLTMTLTFPPTPLRRGYAGEPDQLYLMDHTRNSSWKARALCQHAHTVYSLVNQTAFF